MNYAYDELPPEYVWDEPEHEETFEFFPPPDAEPMTDEDWARMEREYGREHA